MEKEIVEKYQERVTCFSLELSKTRRKGNLLSLTRLLIFIAGIILIYFTFGIHSLLAVTCFFLSGFLFLFVVKKHGQNNRQQRHLKELIKINEHELRGMKGDISPFDNGSEFVNTTHSFSFDLDLFGDGSLFQYLNRTCSSGGKKRLMNLLTMPLNDHSGIRSRQDAVRELTPGLDWRQQFLAAGNSYEEYGQEEQSILEWANKTPEFNNSRILPVIRFLVPLVTVLLLGLSLFRIIHFSLPIAMILIQLLIVAVHLVRINRVHQQVTKRYEMLKKSAKLLSFIQHEKFSSPFLISLQETLDQDGYSASFHIHRLARIIHRFDRRLDMIIGVLLNGLLMWDIHCVIALDEWRSELRDKIPLWFAAVSEVDALISLSSFSYNNPDYPFPEIEPDKPLLSTKLGHPLIPRSERVCNDFQLNKEGGLVILTGPNMAGKSTFLRTVGINLVLSMVGAPVCAGKFSFTPVEIYSSMRTSDSLQKNESYFYAELRRLKVLKESLMKQKKIMILLDEILKGTNSKDKHAGSIMFIEELIGMKGTGLIATHDVELGKLEKKFPDQISNKCFEVEINGDQISFDYILREGITQKMNAAHLMRQMGIVRSD